MASSRDSVLFFIFFCCLHVSSFAIDDSDDYLLFEPSLDQGEQDAVYSILEAVNTDVQWRSKYPEDLCEAGPHGIVCEVDQQNPSRAHVVQLNLGWVSDYSNNPPCSATNTSFPPSLALTRLPYLRKLFFYRCFTSRTPISLPPYVWSLGSQLEELVLHSNPSLIGSLPSDVSKLVGLRRLIISGNNGVSGAIPADIGALRRLQQLDFSNNGFNGGIPFSIGLLKDLIVLDLSQNQLAGRIPWEIGSLTKLSKLDLSSNNLTGNIPASLAALKDLEMLDLSRNGISGGVPFFLGEIRGLNSLQLSGNPIGGSLPNFWFGLKELVNLDLSRTGLVGQIPASVGKLEKLSYLALDHNNLSGSIPQAIAALPSIHHVDLSHNQLSGLIPFSSVMVERLGQRLRLGGNQELCFDSDTPVSFAEKVDIAGCSSSSSSVALEQSLDGSSSGSRSRLNGHYREPLLALFLFFFQLLF